MSMTTKVVASFKVKYLQFLDENGQLVDPNPPKLSAEQLRYFLRMMMITRELDLKTIHYQRQGRVGTYVPVEGQEACQIGSAACMIPEDWVFPAFREQGVFLMRGLPARYVLLYFMGSEEGNRIPENMRIYPISAPVASQIPIAVGCAMALKIKKEKGVVITYFSDGATSEGDFSEALNFATVFKTPTVFICQNNQWAISVPRSKQSAASTLAQKAIAYEMETLQVDGNDVLAVYQASQYALDRARKGEGPTFLELITYRRQMHSTADDPKKYLNLEEHEKWMARDPITRFEKYLRDQKIIDDAFIEDVHAEAEQLMKQEFEEAERIIKAQSRDDIFRYTYETMPPHLKEQLEEMKRHDD